MKTFVINLPKAQERRDHIKKELVNSYLDYVFFEAVYGKNLSEEELKSVINFDKAEKTWKKMNLAEVGCALSHMNIYRKMIAEDIEEAIIFEDDIVLKQNFNEIMDKFSEWKPNKAELILLGCHNGGWLKNQVVKNISESCSIGKMYVFTGGTHAYYITKQGAKKVLEKCMPLERPMDDIANDGAYTGVQLYGVIPPIVDILHAESQIAAGDVKFNGIWLNLKLRKAVMDGWMSYNTAVFLRKVRYAFGKKKPL